MPHFDTVILGGGPAGLHAAHRVRCVAPDATVAVVEARDVVPYAPFLPLLASGIVPADRAARRVDAHIANSTCRLRSEVAAVDPNERCVCLADGTVLTYKTLIVADEPQRDWSSVTGSVGTAPSEHSNVLHCTDAASAARTHERLENASGHVVFVLADHPVAAREAWTTAAMLDARLRETGRREEVRISVVMEGEGLFRSNADRALLANAERRGIRVVPGRTLRCVDAETAWFAEPSSSAAHPERFDLLFVAPGVTRPSVAGLNDTDGRLPYRRDTRRHRDHAEVFVVDGAAPTAAACEQARVAASNAVARLAGVSDVCRWDGYSGEVIVTGHGRAVLIETSDAATARPRTPFAPGVEGRAAYHFALSGAEDRAWPLT